MIFDNFAKKDPDNNQNPNIFKILSFVNIAAPYIAFVCILFFQQVFENKNRSLLSLVTDVFAFNVTHVVFSFLLLFIYNREFDFFHKYKIEYNIDVKKRIALVGILYLLFFMGCEFYKNDYPFLKTIDNIVFLVLIFEHGFQQSKGILLKKIKKSYSDINYVEINRNLNFLKWVVITSLVVIQLKQFIWPLFKISGDPYWGYYALIVPLFFYIYLRFFPKKPILLTLFSTRFFLFLFISFYNVRGFFHGIEYLSILKKLNSHQISKFKNYQFYLNLQIISGILFFLLLGFFYTLLVYKHPVAPYLVQFLKALVMTHSLVDHYMFSQRYTLARKISSAI